MMTSSELYADEQTIPNTSIEDLDIPKFELYIKRMEERTDMTFDNVSVDKLMENLKIINNSNCTLAGMLLFGRNTYKLSYQALIGAVSWYGNEISGDKYIDREDIRGNIGQLFKGGMIFIRRNLRKIQKSHDFNTNGVLEVPEVALQEALINALVHRNYFLAANIRVMIFENRVEIISPGVLPNTLTVDSIKAGINVQRNPILNSLIRDIKEIPYSGMGSGIPRILRSCRQEDIRVEFINDTLGQQFKVIFYRKQI